MNKKLLLALDLCMAEDWDAAKLSLEGLDDAAAARLAMLITLQQEREKNHLQMLKKARHELGNTLSVAQANLEAMLDGVLETTPERLRSIADSLRAAGAVVLDLK
ncbi:MAG TPA: hypothetical protein VFO29_02870 [Candidatus Rubrimentiphilum sp.]|nr:hypothetical protein [Candidatus Rubrimentiphilum sp.]